MSGERLAQYLGGLGKQPNNFIFGVVQSINPIKIRVEGLPLLSGKQLIISDTLKKKVVKIPRESDPTKFYDVTIFEDLKQNEKVFIIRSIDRQTFYVVERLK